jgi:type IV secretion system protein VirB1
MDHNAFLLLAVACAPLVHPSTTSAIVSVESSFNPYAIGVVQGVLERQPRTRNEAIATARSLEAGGWNYSAGLAQINVRHFARLGLDAASVFDACPNLSAMQVVLSECFHRYGDRPEQTALRRALSCYYSGNPVTGFDHGYVQRVVTIARRPGVIHLHNHH